MSGIIIGEGLTLATSDLGAGVTTFTVGSELAVPGTVRVYCQSLLTYGASLTEVATRVGLGDLSATLDAGPYFAIATDDANLASAGVMFRVGDDELALHLRCLNAVRETVLQLAIDGLPVDGDKHRVVKFPFRPGTEFSQEGVFYYPKSETYAMEDNRRDTVTYPVQVVWLRPSAKALEDNLAEMLKQRETMFRAFSRISLSDVCEVHTVNIKPGAVALPEAWGKAVDASSVLFELVTQQDSRI